ncbi:type II toxin-antitoxin system VapC family toxin [Candidatus Nitrospira nitrificans]|uniref:Ribonuclease VapC n=1 Tax=Candidatus Nitrospira nitrificans TaxID=1742973 RepID=A0A0S4L7S1_9BACT|nr:PIN domain-containing protein [Candidatus Nitrospira nitrificans]CUS32809.1 PilT protein-like protein [Candidatus Nitrospira nitrificans]
MVIADTSVWIPFFNRPDSPEKATLDLLIDADEVVLVGVVLAELLQGCRTSSERDTLSDALLALPYHEVTQSTWSQTGNLSSQLLRRGVTLPLSDLIIAALAIEHNCHVYSLDIHFKRIPGVRLYPPA